MRRSPALAPAPVLAAAPVLADKGAVADDGTAEPDPVAAATAAIGEVPGVSGTMARGFVTGCLASSPPVETLEESQAHGVRIGRRLVPIVTAGTSISRGTVVEACAAERG